MARQTRSHKPDNSPPEPHYAPLEDDPFVGALDNPFGALLDEPPDSPLDVWGAQPAKPKRPSELEKTDLAALFGPDGPLAEALEGYEMRPSQVEMAQAIKRCLQAERHALIEAPTGTGKSIAYLIPAILSGKTVVVATANKSLQSQLYQKDIPFLRKVLNKPIPAVVVKGRSNYICTYKWEQEDFEQQRFAFMDRENEQASFVRSWLKTTETGDVDDLPFVLDSDLRPRLVSFPDDCLHSDCRHFHDNCWINKMRDKAAEAQVLITNHHLMLNALELGWAGERILPLSSVYIIDEAHQLEQTATSVFEYTLTDYTVEQLLNRSVIKEQADAEEIDELRFHNTLAFQEVAHLSRDNAFRIEPELEEMKKLARSLNALNDKLRKNNPFSDGNETAPFADEAEPPQKEGKSADDELAEKRRAYELVLSELTSTVNKLLAVASNNRDADFVRYAVRVFDRRHVSLELHAAPINPATLLSEFLFQPEMENAEGEPLARTVICTSATLATNNQFAHFKQRCGVVETGEELVLPAVFDYSRQTLLYQPALPAYDWRNADRYYDAVAQEITRLLEASRGRALCLFTSWSGLQQVRDRLVDGEHYSIWPIRAQGDAPRDALLAWFKETPHSVLLATRSFWEGVDIPGDDLSLVVLDKMPFPTPGDPLHSARMSNIDESGQSSFGNYMLPLMTLALKQGFGRLIRRTTDQGVVAILDERLTSKGYGRQARQDLPPARFSRNFSDVHQFYRRALDSQADFVLNVWALTGEHAAASARWRWQLLRLQDGKSDAQEGQSDQSATSVYTEIAGAIAGLQDLRQRIERVNRPTDQFGVELRCSPEAAQQMQMVDTQEALLLQWQAEKSRWKQVDLLGLAPVFAASPHTDESTFSDSTTDFELANDGNPF